MNVNTAVHRILVLTLVSSLLLVPVPAAQAAPGDTTRVSVASDGTQGNDGSALPSISVDGRYVAFRSYATNLVSGDTNGTNDIFVHDRQTGATSRVSVASDGTQGNGDSDFPFISADGRYVAFESGASNLVSGDTNGKRDIFVHDRQAGETSRVSVASDGTQGNGYSYYPSISADGHDVAFQSYATNLVSGDTNGKADIFVHDRQMGATSRVSVASEGTQGNGDSDFSSISADGRYVAFMSVASNLVSGDTNGKGDVFVRDRQAGETSRVSVASGGTQGNKESYYPTISTDGAFVAFESLASNLVSADWNGGADVYVHDRGTGATSRVSVASDGTEGNDWSGSPSISADGRYVAFWSSATNLVSGDTNGTWDVFAHDRQTGETGLVSVASDGTHGAAGGANASISADGRYVAFDSWSSNLVSGDTNMTGDVFVHEYGASTNLITISGNAGASGVTLDYLDGIGKSVLSDAAGNYSISVPYGWSGTVTPSKAGYTFDPASKTYPPLLADQTDENYTAIPITYMISGNAGVAGATLSYTDDTAKTATADGSGNYSFSVSYNWSGTVTPSKTGYTFSPAHISYNNVMTDQTGQDYAATHNNQPPTDISLSHSQIVEGKPAGTIVGTLSAVDPDPGDSLTFSLATAAGCPGTGNGSFQIAGNILQTAAILDYETQSSYDICIEVNDGHGNMYNESFGISVLDSPPVTMRVFSVGVHDGWILESTATNSTATTLLVGDNAWDKQYRSILSFNTTGLPDNAVITTVTLKIKRAGLPVGTNPFATHGKLLVDVRKGCFSGNCALQLQDFQALACKNAAMAFTNNPVNGWYTKMMPLTGFTCINEAGLTQFRLRFYKDDNDDLGADYLKFYSGNALTASLRPQLIIRYYVP